MGNTSLLVLAAAALAKDSKAPDPGVACIRHAVNKYDDDKTQTRYLRFLLAASPRVILGLINERDALLERVGDLVFELDQCPCGSGKINENCCARDVE